MSDNKINLNNSVMGGRVKKYDTYQQRGSSSLRRVVPTNRATSDVKPMNYRQNVAHKSVVQTNSNDILTTKQPTISAQFVKKPITPITTTHKPVKSSQSILNTQASQISRNPKVQQPANKTKKLAMTAVNTAQIFDNEQYPDNETTIYGSAKRKLTLLQKMMYGFGAVVLLFATFVSVQSFITNNQAKEQIATLGENSSRDEYGVSEGTGDEPSEEQISESAIRAFQVPDPRDPRYLRIPELGVFARIKNLGITAEGAVDAPRNIYDTGWYNGSARPGATAGASLVLGHVSGWTGPGVFKQINRLVPGSQFEIEKGNGEVVRYSVTKSEQLPLDQIDMSKILGTETAGEHDIKLMTCSGRYNNETKTFEDRFVVYATQIK